MEYNHKKIEKKWQNKWDELGLAKAEDTSEKPKFYCLVEFPYPSGDGLHVGHVRSYTALDVICRKKRMQGFNVMYPMGWDAFGLPTENFAIKTGKHPAEVTKENIAVFKKQMKDIGISFDWSREINTTDPKYFKWTQWIFLKLLEKGLAYKKEMPINWCPSCKIGLANEEVVDGKCERCGTESVRKNMNQWMLKITAYADRLIEDLETVDYLEQIKTSQINWIGRSYGAEVDFNVKGTDDKIKVFTTRPDTLFGATFMVLSPEHELVNEITTNEREGEILKYQDEAKKKSDLERTELQKDKSGVFTGAFAINPVNGQEVPIWIADYVLSTYGTGAIMAVPAHDQRDWDFAKKYDIDVLQVIDGEGADIVAEAYTNIEKGVMINSHQFNGQGVQECQNNVLDWLEKEEIGKRTTQYHLRDWVFSRQHYWGEPIPVVHCDKCGTVPLSEKDLPLELPDIEKYEPTDTGESPLADITEWVHTTCPTCGGPAKRETDTMPNWAGSSWYFLRYLDPHNDEALADFDKMKYWMPVDLYNGGMEHVTLHLLYSRFWNKFLYDAGVVPTSEPYQKRITHGMIMASDGNKMSKSKGNVINPDEIVSEFGADVLRVYEMFIGPYDQPVAWDTNGLKGVKKLLDKIYNFEIDDSIEEDETTLRALHKMIKKVTEDIDKRHFNTAISSIMIFVNHIMKKGANMGVFREFVQVLFPFAPHLADELWSGKLGEEGSVQQQEWPKFNSDLAKDDQVEIVIQVNGKVRDRILSSPEIEEEKIKEQALASEKVLSFLNGKEPKKVIYVKGKLVSIVI